jgi:hypothetical protein
MPNDSDRAPENLILRMLRDMAHKQDLMHDDIRDLKSRMTALEGTMAIFVGSMATMNSRLDRVEARLDRIERRLELSEHA